MQESIVFLVRVQCRRKESSRSLSHVLMSFLLHQMFNLFALLRDDLVKPATPLTNGAIDETLQ